MNVIKEFVFGSSDKEPQDLGNHEDLKESTQQVDTQNPAHDEATALPSQEVEITREAVINETVKPEELVEVQPVIHRER